MSIDEKLDRSVEIIHKLNALKEDLQILEENAIVDTGTDEMLISVGDAIYNHTISAGGRRLYKVMVPHLMAAIKEISILSYSNKSMAIAMCSLPEQLMASVMPIRGNLPNWVSI